MAKKTGRKRNRKQATGRSPVAKRAAPPQSAPAALADDMPPEGLRPGDIEPADLSALKDGKLYYRIGEVSQITGVKPYVLRYWESEFRLMAPQKSRSKQRLYRQKDIEMILAIKRLLYEERYTIAGARRRLRELGPEARAEMVAEITDVEKGRAAEASSARDTYRRIRDELLAIRSLLSAEL
jgi:DNA-binding transcriptional MerR regulator